MGIEPMTLFLPRTRSTTEPSRRDDLDKYYTSNLGLDYLKNILHNKKYAQKNNIYINFVNSVIFIQFHSG